MTEQELISGIVAKDREAISLLVKSYQDKVIKTSYYFLGNMEDAEDLAQDIFLEIVSSMGRFRKSSTLSTWIYRITVNRSLNALRRNRRRSIFMRLEQLFGKNGNTQDTIDIHKSSTSLPLENKETKIILREAVDALPVNQRTAFVLAKYDELTYKEIAEVMKTSVSSVESLMHRAKINLQKSLVNHFSEYSKGKE